jgi:hypothetical protein
MENGARIEKIQLTGDLYYKRNKRTIGFHLFSFRKLMLKI